MAEPVAKKAKGATPATAKNKGKVKGTGVAKGKQPLKKNTRSTRTTTPQAGKGRPNVYRYQGFVA